MRRQKIVKIPVPTHKGPEEADTHEENMNKRKPRGGSNRSVSSRYCGDLVIEKKAKFDKSKLGVRFSCVQFQLGGMSERDSARLAGWVFLI